MRPVRTTHTEEAPVVAAIETLSNIADLELASVMHDPSMASPPQKETSIVVSTVRWLHQKNAERMQTIIRDKLHVLLKYFEHAYASEKERFARKESLKGIRTVMLLADEAAENLDRYTQLFLGVQRPSVKSTKEFRDLCEFYTKKIAPISALEKKAPKIGALPIAEILAQAGVQAPTWAAQMVLTPLTLELEDIQRDVDYELLFLRKEDGSRFFTPKLIRSMKLACDIERAVDWEGKAVAPPEVELLRRTAAADGARTMLYSGYPAIDTLFHYARRAVTHQPVMDFYAPCIALLEASIQAIHHSEAPRAKGVIEYYNDFRTLLSGAMRSTEFKRLLTYPPVNEHSWEYAVTHLSEVLASSFVMGAPLSTDLIRSFIGFTNAGALKAIEEVGPQDGTLSQWLNIQYAALRHLLSTTANVTLARMLEQLENVQPYQFEPLIDGSPPHQLCQLSWADRVIPVVQLPSPTRQERIDGAVPTEVFQVALHHMVPKAGPVLIINLQDGTGWRDGARCQAIEGLQASDEIGSKVRVLTIAKDGEWYQQEGEFEGFSSAKHFKEVLVEQILGETVRQPEGVHLSKESLRHLVDTLHAAMYGGRNLTRTMRCELIDLVHIFLILRAIEETRPGCVLVCCKDGLDITGTALGGLFSFLKLFNRRLFSEEERDWLGTTLFGLPLIERERLLFPDRYSRMVNLIKVLEGATVDGGSLTDPAALRAVAQFLPHESASAALLPSIERRG
jgi:hypothetical protein